MRLAERIKTDVGTAMKARDRDRVGALRLMLAELQQDAKEGAGDEQAVLRRERKRRRDAETAFRDAGRPELADREAYEGTLIDAYLPSQLDDAELDVLVRAAIAETGAESVRDMGRVIKHAMTAAAGRAEGARVSARVKEALAA
ncbi:MAG: GatB/YqeY domain-containing protein [Solirubrobacteraceae bacterium]